MLLDKIIHKLDDQNASVPLHQDRLYDIKNNVKILLNSKLDDCLTFNDLGSFSNAVELNFNSSDLCQIMAKEIARIIQQYEKRIKILSISYDNSLTPWRLTFLLRFTMRDDNFQECNLEIIFKNNRYCEVV